ncbi:hypothetical protein CMV_018071 [Castanea mollissima]|uniref:Uncharacterized protein n=1 Tax=Castanea mollissima TaxID=60419 RepID=A0A8J4QPD8_9ROSI|nr:hypothetical protein CMV_018071 [Castanea mollissima]
MDPLATQTKSTAWFDDFDCQRMTVLKRYVLRLLISMKYITANVAAAVVGEVLAMRLRVEGLEQGQGRGIHVDLNKEVEKKGFKNRTKIWAIVNSLRNNGVKLILDGDDDSASRPS